MKKCFFTLLMMEILLALTGCATQASSYNKNGLEFYNEKKYAQAEEMFLQATTFDSTNPFYFCNLGMNYLEMKEYDKALMAFDDSIRLRPAQQLAYRGKGIVKMEQKDYDAAISLFKEAVRHTGLLVNEIDYDILAYRANAEEAGGFFLEACETYTSLIQLEYHVDEMYFRRACVYLEMNQTEEALQDFQKSVEISREDSDRYFQIYQKLEQSGYAEKGTAYLNKILNQEDTSDSGHINRGKAYYILGKYQNAQTELSKVSQFDYPEVTLYRGLCYENLGEIVEAVKIYNNFTLNYNRTSPYDQAILAQHAYAAAKLNDLTTAKQKLAEAESLGESSIYQDILWNQVMNYSEMSEYQDAYDTATKYKEKYPEDSKIDNEIAYILMQISVQEVP